MLVLVTQGHGFFHIGCSEHEAARVAACDCPAIPFCPTLEEQVLPQTDWIEEALTELLP